MASESNQGDSPSSDDIKQNSHEDGKRDTAKSPQKHTSKMQVNTPSGILSITTTIEDSKINEIVLEKKPPPGSESVNATDVPNNDDVIRQSSAKSLNKNKEIIEAAVTDVIKQVNVNPNVTTTTASTSSSSGQKPQEKAVTETYTKRMNKRILLQFIVYRKGAGSI